MKCSPLFGLIGSVVCSGVFALPATADDNLGARTAQLERETQALRAELEWLRTQPTRLPPVDTTPAGMSYASLAPQADEQYFTWGELQAEMKRLAFTKGDFRIVPYGAFWADAIYQTERTNPGSYTTFVPSREVEGENAFIVDARRTRLGLNIDGPRIPMLHNAASSAQVEIDFQSPVTDSTENKPTVQLRHAYWQAKNDYYRVLIGQYWDVISPLNTDTLNYSVGWVGGNIGYRRTQFRFERYFHLDSNLLLTSQIAIAQNIVTDSIAGVKRESGGWPILQGRLATTLGDRKNGLPIEVGVSGHIGETGFDFLPAGPPLPEDDRRFRTWSMNVDMKVPITERLAVKGEFFTGENLSAFVGGIGQGICVINRSTIRSTGGWFDVTYKLTNRWRVVAGWGLDDPNDNDLMVGRTYNQFIFANTTYDVTKSLVTGFEVTSWRTLYQDLRPAPDFTGPTAPGESVVFQWMVKYGF
ncbi:MAG: hypothetical protein RBS80_06820 [Thermoguttaceae bacterium]|jgi:hypothetical protein|nr:hypothetical protein [Thermoguttaceae bacterium]